MNQTNSKAHAYINQGNNAELTGDLDKALSCYNKAISIDTRNAEALYRAGYVNFRLGNLDTASTHLGRCVNLARNNSVAQYMHGRILHATGDISRARRAFKLALKASPGHLDAVAGIASIYEYQQQFDRAYNTIRPVVESGRVNHQISILFTRICGQINAFDEALAYSELCIASGQITDPDAISYLYYAAGDACDSAGKYTRAFGYYRKANDARKLPYDPFSHENLVARLKSIYSPANIIECATSKLDTEKPIFIVGMPRSGTSLVEQILSTHSRVYGGGELAIISAIVGKITHRKGSPEQYTEAFRSLSNAQLREYAREYLDAINKLDRSSEHITDKMPHNFMYLGLIGQLFPRCRIIHCRRHPVDTCLSIYFKSFNDSHKYATDFESLAHHYKCYKDIMTYWKSILPVEILDVDYESIVTNFEQEAKRLLKHCGLEWEDQCLDFHNTKRHVGTASQSQVSKPIYTSSILRWTNYKDQIHELVRLMESHGLIQKLETGWEPVLWAN